MAHRRDPDADAELAPSSRRSRQSEAAYVDVAGAESWRKEEQENEAEEEKEKEEKEKEKEKEKEEEKEKENKDETETAEMRKGRNKEEEAVVEENGDAAELLMGMDSFRGASLTFTPERSRVMDAMLSRTGAKRSQTWRMSDQTSPDPPALQPPWSTALKTGGDGVTSASGRSRVWFRAGREEEDEEGSNAEDGGSGLLQADDAVQQDLFKDMVGTAAGDADSSSAWSGRMRMKARTSKLARREVENDLMEFCGMSPISLSMRSISSPLSVFPSTAKKFAATGGGGGREGEALEHPAIRPSKRLSEILNGGSESFEEEVQQVIRNVERYRSENELSSINCSLSKEEAASLHESLQNLGKSIDSSMRNLEKVMNLQAAQTRHVREEIERVIDQRVAEAETSQL
ncbi:hypothetical protein GUITHDRAFT_118350 [Guillardia theta CCMP2712]|uniref:Uncharacterized protein n=1 Tax=Guillardia theta (strain CCMP2712) TaxID=905079 RepID=L1IGS6_GUITC|nr:hypothetical protein GUITHDRAFT_118350 [Guillardia theta CCMP2712]EKX35433.1 hypothetical protein GUITHDRAFT_118350 [Guillardia theta CCMP2712]|eukprot:XP_005822413.1 hypothetical protein GUITHDRAFT_118350 [Guillardia theta CCMP2712]